MSKAQVEAELAKGEGLSIISLVDHLITHAHLERASDIHIDPHEVGLRVRFRIDGVMQETYHLPQTVQHEVVARIKVLSGLRTDEHQAAQDGRFRLVLPAAGPVDIRVSTAPTYYGENAVLRLLSDQAEHFGLESLGFNQADKEKILAAVKRPHGMILATGPTGSGKTTTLYTLLKLLNTPEISIITIEDPIEYAIANIEQIQVNARTGLTFANGLRSILRQDPDVIMVGEIRDLETATMAVNTALTGHLLLSTLHTSDAATTLPRLLDMKVEPFLVASTVNIAIGQRLVRKICDQCKTRRQLTAEERASLQTSLPASYAEQLVSLAEGRGCEACSQTGYHGRIGINEVLVVDQAIREAILRKAPASELKKIAVASGMSTLLEDGCQKVLAGQTTMAEVLRLIHD